MLSGCMPRAIARNCFELKFSADGMPATVPSLAGVLHQQAGRTSSVRYQ